MNRKYDCILFDLDGTLTNPRIGIVGSFVYALENLGIPAPASDSELYWVIGPPLRDSFRKYGLDEKQVEEGMRLYRESYERICVSGNEPYEGIAEMLCALHDKGVKLAVATSKPTYFSERILQSFDLVKHFELVSGSDLDGSRDAKSLVIEYALEKMSITDRAGVLMVGDRFYDAEGAAQCGLDSVLVAYGFASTQEFETASATYRAKTVKELSSLLLSLT